MARSEAGRENRIEREMRGKERLNNIPMHMFST